MQGQELGGVAAGFLPESSPQAGRRVPSMQSSGAFGPHTGPRGGLPGSIDQSHQGMEVLIGDWHAKRPRIGVFAGSTAASGNPKDCQFRLLTPMEPFQPKIWNGRDGDRTLLFAERFQTQDPMRTMQDLTAHGTRRSKNIKFRTEDGCTAVGQMITPPIAVWLDYDLRADGITRAAREHCKTWPETCHRSPRSIAFI
jgi:hypothetical protein